MFGVARHWTDSAGGADASDNPTSGAERQVDRQHKVRIANEVLEVFGLKLGNWMNRYTLANHTGRHEVIDNLGAVWPLAEQLIGRPCDPLSNEVIGAIEARRLSSGD